MRTGLLLAAAGLLAGDLSAQGRVQRPMTFEDFAAVRNVGDPQVSPDGKWVLYSLRTTDVGANKRTSVTKRQPVGGGTPLQFPGLTTLASEARWSPDGKSAQISLRPIVGLGRTGSNARRITTSAWGIRAVWAPTGE